MRAAVRRLQRGFVERGRAGAQNFVEIGVHSRRPLRGLALYKPGRTGRQTERSMSVFNSGNVAVITGAASGIGRAAAEIFAARGMRLVLMDRSGEELSRLAASLPAGPRRHRRRLPLRGRRTPARRGLFRLRRRACADEQRRDRQRLEKLGHAARAGARSSTSTCGASSTASKPSRSGCWGRARRPPSSTPAPSRASPTRPAIPPTRPPRPACAR